MTLYDFWGIAPDPITRKSPLPYPGGKTRARHIIKHHLPKGIKEMISPFCGGASFELHCAADGIKVHAYDLYRDLIAWWQLVKKDPEGLALAVKKYYPVDSDLFWHCHNTYNQTSDPYDKVAKFFIVQKCSYSAFGFAKAWYSKGMSLDNVEDIATFNAPNIEFDCKHFKNSLQQHECFAYLDPPYMVKNGNYYGKQGKLHKQFDHLALAEILKQRDNWILSYNRCPEIEALYHGYHFEYPVWSQSLNHNDMGHHTCSEILVLNV